MRVLFDHGTPSGIAAWLVDHKVTESRELGWEKLSNGELLRVAENAGFEVLLTTDKNIALQQNLKGRAIGVVALGNSPWRLCSDMSEELPLPLMDRRQGVTRRLTFRSDSDALAWRTTPHFP